MSRVKIYTLGCKLNQLESESYRELFANTDEELIIINTCTVTSKAEQKARRVIRKALKDYPDAKVIVTGCYAALDKDVIGKIASRRDAEAQRLVVKTKEELLQDKFDFFPEKFSKHTRSFLKIQDGCNNKCTYCRIRLARGQSVSLSAEKVLERLRILEQNHAEAVLTGVNISQYNSASLRLGEMIDYLLANTDKIAIRLSSLDPQFVVDYLFPVPCSLLSDRVRPHFHLSIQSCSEKILKRMGRAYNAETIEKAVTLLRSAKDDPFLACDIITGFPGETQEDFNETYELCKKIGFAWIHVFPYSKRSGTAAADFKETVQESEVTRRVQLLTDLAWQGRKQYIKRWLGRETETIIERRMKKEERKKREQRAESSTTSVEQSTECFGITENYLKILIKYENKQLLAAGTVLRCRLIEEGTKFKEYDVIGHPIA